MEQAAERDQALWILPASPVLWSLHFMVCYITAAIWCGKVVGRLDAVPTLRLMIAVYTVVALAGIVVVGWMGYRAHRRGSASLPHDDDTPEDRHRFMGFATLLLSGLSFVAVIYSGLVAVFLETCQ